MKLETYRLGIPTQLIFLYPILEKHSIFIISQWFLPVSYSQLKLAMFGESIEDVIGVEVKTLIDTAYKQAQEILKANMDKLEIVANLLLQKETITAEEFDEVFE